MDGEVTAIVRQREIQKIMGKENFFGIKEAIKYFKVNPTDQDLKDLAKIPFSKPVLKELRNTHILVAVFPLSILDIRKMNAELFYDQAWWYKDKDDSFAKERGKASWQLIRKTPIPNSTSKNWSEQQKLLSKDDKVPTARVMVYTIIGHYLATDDRLFKKTWVRTSSLPSYGDSVCVGCFGSLDLVIDNYWDNYDFDSHGVSSARKF